MFEQMDELRELLDHVNIFQIRMSGYEADDLIYSYTKKNQGRSTIVTSDHDFYQALNDNVEIYDAMKNEVWTKERFIDHYGFSPELWVDVGGIAGDSGDNIFGVRGWGEKTACKYVIEYGNMKNVIDGISKKEKHGKKEEVLLESLEIMNLARSLKQMDNIEVPDVVYKDIYESERLKKWCMQYGFISLVRDLGYLL